MIATKKLVSIAVAMSFALANVGQAQAVSSGSIVHDPINLIENALSATESKIQTGLQQSQLAQTIKQYWDTYNYYKHIYDQFKVTKEQIRSMGNGEIFRLAKKLGGESAALADLAYRIQSTNGNLRNLREMYKWFDGYASYTGMTPETLFWNEKWRKYQAREADKSFLANLDRGLQTTNEDIRKINDLQAQIQDGSADGLSNIKAGLEKVNLHLNLVAGQNLQLISLIREAMYVNAQKKQPEDTMDDQKEYIAYQRQQYEFSRMQQLRNQSRVNFESRWNAQGFK